MKKAVQTETRLEKNDRWVTEITYDDGSKRIIGKDDPEPSLSDQFAESREKWVRGLASEIAVEACKAGNVFSVLPDALARQAVSIASGIHDRTSSAAINQCSPQSPIFPENMLATEGKNPTPHSDTCSTMCCVCQAEAEFRFNIGLLRPVSLCRQCSASIAMQWVLFKANAEWPSAKL